MDVAELFAEVRDSLADVFASIEWAEDEIAAAQRRWPARSDALFHSFSLIRPPVELLERLGFAVTARDAEGADVIAPSWRPDVEGKADLVEEVMRLTGVDAITPQPLPREGAVAGRVLTTAQLRDRLARRALAARGMLETVTYAFIPHEEAVAFGGGAPELQLENPIAAELTDMRPSLLPSLLAAGGRNAARGYGDVALFEVAGTYESDTPDGQRRVAGGIRRGTATLTGAGRAWDGHAAAVGVFDAKADALAAPEGEHGVDRPHADIHGGVDGGALQRRPVAGRGQGRRRGGKRGPGA